MRRSAERGKYVTANPPFGYRLEVTLNAQGERQSRLVPDPAHVETLRRIFREFIADKPTNQIARDLHFEGVPTQRAGGKWQPTTIRAILKNPVYRGYIRFKGETFLRDGKPAHEPLIDQDTWVQACSSGRPAPPARGAGGGAGRLGRTCWSKAC